MPRNRFPSAGHLHRRRHGRIWRTRIPVRPERSRRWLMDAGCRHAGPGNLPPGLSQWKMDSPKRRLSVISSLATQRSASAGHETIAREVRVRNQRFARRTHRFCRAPRTRIGLCGRRRGVCGLAKIRCSCWQNCWNASPLGRFISAGQCHSGRQFRLPYWALPIAGNPPLLNALLGDDRAIVSATPARHATPWKTPVSWKDIKFRFIDTAGIRETDDAIESEGIRRALDKAQSAAVVLYLMDTTCDAAINPEDRLAELNVDSDTTLALVWNKTDAMPAPDRSVQNVRSFHISAQEGKGISEIKAWLLDRARGQYDNDSIVVTNLRHYEALVSTKLALEATRIGLSNQVPGDLVASDVRQALHHLGTITGAIDPEDILDHIFSNFCIGK